MFGLSEYKAGYVTSVFFSIRIHGRERWFSAAFQINAVRMLCGPPSPPMRLVRSTARCARTSSRRSGT
ncbi:DUF1419 domain-containing protein [Mesorhizobium sp. M1005]